VIVATGAMARGRADLEAPLPRSSSEALLAEAAHRTDLLAGVGSTCRTTTYPGLMKDRTGDAGARIPWFALVP
jgi:hypothetical protein